MSISEKLVRVNDEKLAIKESIDNKGISTVGKTFEEYSELIDNIGYWDGTIATEFAGGTGTESDPYLISNGSELAHLADVCNSGTDATLGKYYKLTKNIYLNNYNMTFDIASGLVLVKNNAGEIQCCLGTGIKGTTYNTSTAGTIGTIYASSSATDNNLTTGTIPTDLHSWTPIGVVTTSKEFQGTFDGNNLTISGIYINTTISYQGLFGYNIGATIKNVGTINGSIIVGTGTRVAGVVGSNITMSTVINCYNTNTIVGNAYNTGGVVGLNEGIISDCYNKGVIICNHQGGGVVGSNNNAGTATNCYNIGIVNGTGSKIGGIVGFNIANSIVEDCYNLGYINSSNSYIGGVVGDNRETSTVINCYNTGNVTGSIDRVGGVVGFNYINSTVKNCYNIGSIIGYGAYIGGVVGYSASNSIINNNYNTGSVNGASNTGGIAGRNENLSTIINSYNSGAITGLNNVGGITGYNYLSSIISNCYNIGEINGNISVGSLAGSNSSTGTNIIEFCYYINGTIAIGSQDGTIGNLSSFDTSDKILNSDIIIGAITYSSNTTSLTYILNAWVNENQDETESYYWWSIERDGEYPTIMKYDLSWIFE